MSSLLEIKNKITSTKNTKKITKAMQLVAASKMKSFQRTAVSVRGYTTEVVRALALTGTEVDETVFAESRSEGKTLFVLMTSDKGLCGGMNARLIRALFRSDAWKNVKAEDRLLITVGRKAAEAAKTHGVKPIRSFQGLSEDMGVVEALAVIEPILEAWLSKEVREVQVVAPEYVNAFTFNTAMRLFLPFTHDQLKTYLHGRLKDDSVERGEAAFFEPGQTEVVGALSQQMMQTVFLEAFFELKATEYSSRMIAMKNATEAADDRIRLLTNAFNKARQNAITRQLSELAAANEAMNSENMYEINNI